MGPYRKSWCRAAYAWWVAALAAVVAVASSCAVAPSLPPMEVEEAKKVTASFSGSAFVPPPRTIDDITAILDQPAAEPSGQLARDQATLGESPPNNGDPAALARFFFARGSAALRLGRSGQALADLRLALQFARQARVSDFQILVNLGSAEEHGGSLTRAIEYRRAAIRSAPRNDLGRLFVVYFNLVWASTRTGDLQLADALLQEADRLNDESTRWRNVPSENRARWSALLAQAHAVVAETRGQYARAEALYRKALAHAASDPVVAASRDADVIHARFSRVLLKQRRLLEAEHEARSALLACLRHGDRYSFNTVLIADFLVGVLWEQGRFVDAEKLARANVHTLEILRVAPESFHLNHAHRKIAGALAAQGRWPEALREYEGIRARTSADAEMRETHFSGSVPWALALVHMGQPDAALTMLRQMQARGPLNASGQGTMAQAYLAKGDRREALEAFQLATRGILSPSAEVAGQDEESAEESQGVKRDRVILATHIGLLAEICGTDLERQAGVDAAAEAFRLAEVARSQAVQGALNAAAARASAQDPALAELIRKEQDAKLQLAALRSTLANALSLPPDQQNPQVVASLRQQVAVLAQARQTLIEQINRGFPAYAQLVNPPPTTIEQARAALRLGEVLLTTYVTDNRTLVWAVPQAGPVAFAAVPLGAKDLETAVSELRKALNPSATSLGDIPPFDVALAHDLYRRLLEPVKAGWADAKSLLIVAHGPLAQLPFALLPTRSQALAPESGALFSNYRAVPWLVRTHAVTVLPSVTSLATLRGLPPGNPTRRPFVGFGDPYFSEQQARRAVLREERHETQPALGIRGVPISLRNSPPSQGVAAGQLAMLPRLPETADEIRSMALAMNADLTKDVFLGAQATEHTVRRLDLSGYRVIVFATHGLVPGDLDGLTQPALALTAPEVAKTDGDGLLTMEKILSLRLNADWVVLSACNTASGNGAGSEAISGLGRAFFYAGARALLVSNWPVETTSAKWLTTELFHRQAAEPAQTRAQALQQTQHALIDRAGYVDPTMKQFVYSYAHPIFWAPFTLVGDGGAN